MASDSAERASPYRCCSICSGLGAVESASQKWGWEEHDTHLPAAVGQLLIVRDSPSDPSRTVCLMRCPECGTYYLYRSDYTYLANGSEDEQTVTRLSDEEAATYS